jgi:hypothetical protein
VDDADDVSSDDAMTDDASSMDDSAADDASNPATDDGPVDPIPAPPGVNEVELLPSNVRFSEPLAIDEWWDDDNKQSQIQFEEELALGFQVSPWPYGQYLVSGGVTIAPYEGDGRYCLSGESGYRSQAFGMFFYPNNGTEEPALGWDPSSIGAVGVVFDVERTPVDEGVYFVGQVNGGGDTGGRDIMDGRWVEHFADADGNRYLTTADRGSRLYLRFGTIEAIWFVTHATETEDFLETRPYDYCFSNVRLIFETP